MLTFPVAPHGDGRLVLLSAHVRSLNFPTCDLVRPDVTGDLLETRLNKR